MLNEQDIKVDSFRLKDGRKVYRMVHLPSGVCVVEEPDDDAPVLERLRKLMQQLEGQVEHQSL